MKVTDDHASCVAFQRLTSKSLKFRRDGQSTDESMSPEGVFIRITMASVSMSHGLFKPSKSIKRKENAS